MRSFATILLLSILMTSCTKSGESGVPLQRGGTLSRAEQESIIAIHPRLKFWSPSHSAVWIRDGVTQHVCIREGDIVSLTTTSEVFIFDGEGKVVDANIIEAPDAPNRETSKTVSSISPLRVVYRFPKGVVVELGERYPRESSRQDFRKRMEEFESSLGDLQR